MVPNGKITPPIRDAVGSSVYAVTLRPGVKVVNSILGIEEGIGFLFDLGVGGAKTEGTRAFKGPESEGGRVWADDALEVVFWDRIDTVTCVVGKTTTTVDERGLDDGATETRSPMHVVELEKTVRERVVRDAVVTVTVRLGLAFLPDPEPARVIIRFVKELSLVSVGFGSECPEDSELPLVLKDSTPLV